MRNLLSLVGVFVLFSCGNVDDDPYEFEDIDDQDEFGDFEMLEKATAAGCKGSGCIGKAPDQQGCSADAVTKATLQRDNVVIKEKYSKACQSTWAYVSRTSSGFISAKVEWGIKDSDGIWVGQTASSKNAMSIKSPMGDASSGLVARACGKGSESASMKCTAW